MIGLSFLSHQPQHQLFCACPLLENLLPIQLSPVVLHSVFQTVVNYSYQGRLVAMMKPKRALVPFGIKPITEYNSLFHSNPYQKVWVSQKELSVDDMSWELIGVDLTFHPIPFHSEDLLGDLLHYLQRLNIPRNQGFNYSSHLCSMIESPQTNQTKDQTALGLPTPSHLLLQTQPQTFALELVGRGMGSTPSGDDFLVGLFLAYYILGKANEDDFLSLQSCLIHLLTQNHTLTTDLGREFILYALGGSFEEGILKLANELVKGELSVVTVTQVLQGGTSGYDFLYGLLWGLNFLS